MGLQYQTWGKIRDIARETAHIRLAAAAERASSQHRRAAPDRKRETPIMPLRVLRALRPAS